MKPFILGAIFARGGSKGVPRKNIRSFNGKPLIAYAIEAGLSVPLIDRIIVSTDDQEIGKIARSYGADVPFVRPKELATDRSPELLSWQHAIRAVEEELNRKVDVLVSLPATSPLKEAGDIEACINKLLKTNADVVLSVTDAHRNPYFNMVTLDKKGNARLAIPAKTALARRQDAPKVYDVTTLVYAARRSYVLRAKSIMQGKVKAIVVPKERSVDIDTLLDFEIAEFLMKRRLRKK